MRALATLALAVWSTWLFIQPAYAEKRVALVIGNSAYQKVAPLTNPANDAAAVALMLKQAGFDSVDSRTDLKAAEMRRALREFGSKTRDADVAVVYYAGHGIEVDNTNYLIPVDAQLETDTDVYDEAFPLDRILVAVEPAKQLRLVILDACRDNPFSRTIKRTVTSRAIGRGLAKVEPTSPNTIIAFAAKAGSTASDGDSKNSPFAVAIVEHLPKPGLDLRRAFGYVRDDVLKNTGNRQEPFVYGSLGGNDVSLVPAKPVATGPQADPQAAVRRDYELALQAGDRDAWEAFLQAYPDGFYANLAKVQLKKIAAEEVRASATERARLAEQEKARLAAEGARQAEQAKAAVAAKAAEDTRIAAERAKQVVQEKAAAAEKARQTEEAKAEIAARARATIEKAASDKLTKEKAEAEAARKAEENEQGQKAKLAALSVGAKDAGVTPQGLARSLQVELRRVGCQAGEIGEDWSDTARKSLALFNKYAGQKFDATDANLDALEAVRAKESRVCPLVCKYGYRARGEYCEKIQCRAGYALGEGNACEKAGVNRVETPVSNKLERVRTKQATTDARPASTANKDCYGGSFNSCLSMVIERGQTNSNASNWCHTYCTR